MPFLNIDSNWSNLAQFYNKPFVNKPSVPPRLLQFNSFDDGLVRGGVLNAALATGRDVLRVSKFIASGKGVLFVTKQIGLQLSNPKLESPIPPPLVNKDPTRTYNLGLNTLSQVGVQAAGLHIVRHGLLPKFTSDYNYEKVASNNNILQGNRISPTPAQTFSVDTNGNKNGNPNRLANYLSILNLDSTRPIALQDYNGGSSSVYGIGRTVIRTTNVRTTIDELKYNSDEFKLKLNGFGQVNQYKNPNPQTSTNTTSNTTSNTSTNSTDDGPNTGARSQTVTWSSKDPEPPSLPGLPNTEGNVDINDVSLSNGVVVVIQKKPEPPLTSTFITSDVLLNAERANTGTGDSPTGNLENILLKSPRPYNRTPGVASRNIEKRLGISTSTNVDAINVIDITDSYTYYTTNGAGTSNKLNTGVADLSAYAGEIDGYYGRDMVRLAIEFLNNDAPVLSQASTDDEGKSTTSMVLNTDVLAFRAYIDDFNDGMNAKWNSYRYMGRGEDFYVYEGFTRDISLSFTIYAHNPKEMKPLYRKLNYLMSTFAPDYSKALKMRGNIAYLTVGDYLSRQPGVFTDIKLTGMLDTHWENNMDLKLGNEPKTPQNVVPKHIKVSLSFKPIHNLLPRKSTAQNPFLSNFILPSSNPRSSTDITPNRYTT